MGGVVGGGILYIRSSLNDWNFAMDRYALPSLILAFFWLCTPAKALEWKPISHQNSQLTIVSKTFQAKNLHTASTPESNIERATLNIENTSVGFLILDQLVTTNYCGYPEDTIKEALSTGSWLEKIAKKSGAPDFDFDKSKSERTKFGFARYLDLRGESSRCIVSVFFSRPGMGESCIFGGTEVVFLMACAADHLSESSDLDRRVFDMIENLHTDGTGKNLIQ